MNTIPELESTEIEKELQELIDETRAIVAKAKAANEADAVKVKKVGLYLTFIKQKDSLPLIANTSISGRMRGVQHANQN